MKRRGFLQISFAWIFAIIVGAFIIFLAIYGVTKLTKTAQTTQELKTGKEIGFLLNPLETGSGEEILIPLLLPAESRLYFSCFLSGEFGEQKLTTREQIYEKWSKTDTEVTFQNKYIFAEEVVEGKSFYLLSKPFEFPFKVANLIYVTSLRQEYCFINSPEEVEDELSKLNQSNIFFEDCEDLEKISVCFDSNNDCDIEVSTSQGKIDKQEKTIYYEGDALLYAGIFSEVSNYGCQLERLMQRTNSLLELYKGKSIINSQNQCQSHLDSELAKLETFLEGYESSEDLRNIYSTVEELSGQNKYSECRLW